MNAGARRFARVAARLATGVLVALLALMALALVVPPPPTHGLASHPDPARDYDEAMRRVAAIEARDTPAIRPVCRTRVLTHARRTRDVAVLMHGLTNCPKQFEAFAGRLHARGWNVIVARIPHHGLADRMTRDLGKLEAHELARHTDEVVDVAAGLGEHVTVLGLSLGGVTAAWAGQHRDDVDRAVVIAPMFGVSIVPRPFTAALSRALIALPDRQLWWNPKLRERLDGPEQTYFRFSTRALGEILRLGLAVGASAARRPPAAQEFAMVTLDRDPAVNNGAADAIVARWRKAGAPVETLRFPAGLGLNHDLIDPEQVGARIERVYPELERLLEP